MSTAHPSGRDGIDFFEARSFAAVFGVSMLLAGLIHGELGVLYIVIPAFLYAYSGSLIVAMLPYMLYMTVALPFRLVVEMGVIG